MAGVARGLCAPEQMGDQFGELVRCLCDSILLLQFAEDEGGQSRIMPQREADSFFLRVREVHDPLGHRGSLFYRQSHQATFEATVPIGADPPFPLCFNDFRWHLSKYVSELFGPFHTNGQRCSLEELWEPISWLCLGVDRNSGQAAPAASTRVLLTSPRDGELCLAAVGATLRREAYRSNFHARNIHPMRVALDPDHPSQAEEGHFAHTMLRRPRK